MLELPCQSLNILSKNKTNVYPSIPKVFYRKVGYIGHAPCFHLEYHLEYIKMLNGAKVASLGFFKDKVC